MSEKVRPSSLPKLACCRAFENSPGTSPAAERGTKLDGIIRAAWQELKRRKEEDVLLDDVADLADLATEDVAAVRWAINTMHELSGGEDIETREEQLQAVVPHRQVLTGTMDGLCVGGCFLIDFKTGQERDYKAQMAAYALACMDAYFIDSWTAHLLFIDQQKVVTHFFKEEEARELLDSIINAPVEPTACDYCEWCGKFGTCPLTRRQVQEVQEVAKLMPAATPAALSLPLPPALQELVDNEAKGHAFLSALAVAEKWGDKIRAAIKDKLADGRRSDYFQRVAVSGKKVVNALELCQYMDRLGFEIVLKNCPQFPLAKVQEMFDLKCGRLTVPAKMITTAGGCVQLRLRKIDSRIPHKP